LEDYKSGSGYRPIADIIADYKAEREALVPEMAECEEKYCKAPAGQDEHSSVMNKSVLDQPLAQTNGAPNRTGDETAAPTSGGGDR
jgi:hypothetical protein